MSLSGMVIDRRVEYDDGTVVVFECGAMQVLRDNGTNEFLTESEVEAIADAIPGDL